MDIQQLSSMDVDDKVKLALRLMKAVNSVHPYCMAFSGGKDSVVMEYLSIEAGISVHKVHNCTTIDPPGTISFCKKHHCEIKRSTLSFLDLVERKGLPTMFRRFCCKELKERYISDYLFVGIRRDESNKRSRLYTCFEYTYVYSKKISTSCFMPLLYFTNSDIEWVVEKNSLEMHTLYYDECGKFCVDRRLGCIGCPLQGDRGRSDFKVYPRLLKQIIERAVTFHLKHGRTRYDAYLNAVYNLFYSNNELKKYQQAFHGLFETDPKDILEKYFSITLPNY